MLSMLCLSLPVRRVTLIVHIVIILKRKKLYPGKRDFKMSDELLEDFTKQFIEAHQVPVVTFTWQGGEPTLMGLDYYIKALELQKKYAGGKNN